MNDETSPGLPDDDVTQAHGAGGDTAAGRTFRPSFAGGHLQVGDSFGGRYRILKELGSGGMGVVYQAWDEVLNVVVALKVIRPDKTADAATTREIERRFKRELLLARQVTHRHVVRIHDLGDVDGTKYITMSFVEGEDLVATLKREGKLPIPRVMRIARQIASGLEAAHNAGVIHRDLKPANIMVDAEDHALIMDFGIAQSAGPETTPKPGAAVVINPVLATDSETVLETAGGTVTVSRATGAIIGTLEYMSPEQSKGGLVDHRTDIYAFGLILSDLLLGPRAKRPGTTPWEALQERIVKPPAPLTTRDASVPPALDAVVTQCLQLDPGNRFATTSELVRALERLDDEGNPIPEKRHLTPRMAAIAGVVVAALLGGTWFLASRTQPEAPREPVSVLIADFVNRANDPVFDGLVEPPLTVGLEGATFVEAYSRRDAIRLARTIKPDASLDDAMARLVSMREGVDVIVGGEITRSGDGYAVHVKVTRVTDENVLLDWTAMAAGKDRVLDAVGQVAARVRRTLGDSKSDTAASDGETFTAASLEAAKAYSEAQDLQWAGKVDDAIAAYQRALNLDPGLGRAQSGLAALYANQGRTSEAEASYQAALSMLERMTEREKYRTRGGYYLFKQNGDSAMKEFEALVAQYPADTSGLANLALAHFYRRDMKSARDVGLRASDAYPQNIIRRNNAALYAMYAGDFEEAVRIANDVLTLNPSYVKAFVAMGVSQLGLGQIAQARATYQRLSQLDSATAKSYATTGLIDIALYEGRHQEALQMLNAAIAADRSAGATSSLARRLALRADVLASRDGRAEAIRSAKEAIALTREYGVLYTAGRALIAAGQSPAALEVAQQLDNRLEDVQRLHGALLRGEAALAAGRPRDALAAFEEAQKLDDTWLGRFSLGRAYLALGAFLEASSEFDRCLSRRGEATAVFLDDLPSYRLVPLVHDQLSRAKKGGVAGVTGR